MVEVLSSILTSPPTITLLFIQLGFYSTINFRYLTTKKDVLSTGDPSVLQDVFLYLLLLSLRIHITVRIY